MLDFAPKEIIIWIGSVAMTLGGALITLYILVWKEDRERIKDIEVDRITKTEVQSLMNALKSEIKQDQERLDDKIDRVEENLRDEIRNSGASLQDGISQIVNILLTGASKKRD